MSELMLIFPFQPFWIARTEKSSTNEDVECEVYAGLYSLYFTAIVHQIETVNPPECLFSPEVVILE